LAQTGRTNVEDRYAVCVQWTIDDDLFRLMRRTDNAEVWSMKNAKSPLLIDNLRAATPYTLFITVIDGQSEPVKFTEQFTTTESGMLH
jgi:hypothetical protein